MKFAVLLVTFAIVLYCGAYMFIYSLNYKSKYDTQPVDIGPLTAEKLNSEMSVKTDVETILRKFSTSVENREVLGFEMSEPVTVNYYLLRVESVVGEKPRYSAFATADEELISAIENGAKRLSITGNIRKTDMGLRGRILDGMTYMESQIIREDLGFSTTETVKMYIADYYIVSAKPLNSAEYLPPIIIGGILSVVGAGGLLVLIIKKIKH